MSIRRACLLVTLAVGCNGSSPPPQAEVAAVPVVAPRPAPRPLPLPLATQLSMAGETDDVIVVRDAQALLDAGVPWRELLARARSDESAPQIDQALGVLNALSKFDDGDEAPLKRGGFDLRGGLVLSESKTGAQFLFAAEKPELAAIYLTTLPIVGSERFACGTEEWLPQFISCSTSPQRRSGQASDGAARLSALRAALPGVAFDAMDAVFAFPRQLVHGAAKVEPGRLEVHVIGPSHPIVDMVAPLLVAGPADQLRFVQPGTSFVWARLDPQTAVPPTPPYEAAAEFARTILPTWTGEVLISGNADPAGVQLRAGLSDDRPAKQFYKDSAASRSPGMTFRPDEIPGLRVTADATTMKVGGEPTTLLRVRASGAPYYDSVASVLGLSQAAGLYAAERSLAVVLGYLPTEIAAPRTTAAVDALPPAAAADLRAGAVLALAHLDFNATQSPAMPAVLEALAPFAVSSQIRELKVQNEQTALLSSVTVWVTRPGTAPIWHAVVELIGHTADEEGRAALAAVEATGAGGSPAAFAALAERYPSSRRVAAYQRRAGAGGKGALAGSLLDLLLLIATLFDDDEE